MKVLLMYSPSTDHRLALQAAAPQAKLYVAGSASEAHLEIADADAALGNRYIVRSLPAARRLRWIQSNSVGVDGILSAGLGLRGVQLTCARGLYDVEMAEHGLALLLALTRRLHLLRDDQRARVWRRWTLPGLVNSRVLILGWGGVGRRLAGYLRALGAQVEGVRRQPGGTSEAGFQLWSSADWRQALPGVDFLLLALPLTPLTRHLVGAAELAALPERACVLNLGRGGTLDERALLAALHRGRLAGAALDVFEQEPLPPQHPFWREPRLLLSPHAARSLEQPPYRWEGLFVENLRRFAAGEPLLNLVDQEAGY